ncbi:hypothetical protein AAVH_19788 [Aphelenchoides avenae]|nr:hypothetical protein AAVH_19788 [Aphelenchus avenae]
MTSNQGSDAERGTQQAYDERAAPIQQHIQHLLEEHSRLSTLARQHRPSAQDDVARLLQLHAALRPLTQQIRNYIVDYLRADTEWSRIIAEFKLHVNRAAWAQSSLQQRNVFYHSRSLATTPLDYLFAQLLQHVQRTIEDIESFIKAEPSHSSTAFPTASDATHSVARATTDPTSSQTAASSQNRSPSIRPDPTNQRHRTDPPHGATLVPSSTRRAEGMAQQESWESRMGT